MIAYVLLGSFGLALILWGLASEALTARRIGRRDTPVKPPVRYPDPKESS